LRSGAFSRVSLESMLSEYGVISRLLFSRIRIMPTGAKATYKTPHGQAAPGCDHAAHRVYTIFPTLEIAGSEALEKNSPGAFPFWKVNPSRTFPAPQLRPEPQRIRKVAVRPTMLDDAPALAKFDAVLFEPAAR
jgi:hypothetical protein